MSKLKKLILSTILLSFLLIFLSPPLTESYYSFPTKIDTLDERINIQVVLNTVMSPSPNLTVDGVLGRKSIQAIQAFQESRGLVPDGKVGPITRSALEQAQGVTTTTTSSSNTSNTSSGTNTTNTSSNNNTSTTSITVGCIPGGLYNTQTGKLCTTTTSSSNGCTSSTKYSPITGAYCGNTTTTTTTGTTSGGGGSTSNTDTNYCTGSSYKSCTISNGTGIQSRLCNNGKWSSYDTCTVSSCSSGYQKSGNSCIQTSCSGSSSQSCSISNGSGIQSRTCSNGYWSSYNSCTVSTCNSGYQISGNTCVVIPSTSTPTTSTKIVNVTSSSNDGNIDKNTLDRVFSDTSRWAANGDGQYITYELNQTSTVSYLRIAFYSTSQRYFEIQYSTNGTTWSNATSRLTSAANKANQYQTFSFTPVQAKYIRILGHGSSAPSLWNSITETDINGFEVALTSIPTTCSGSSSQSCSISNGSGTQSRTCTNGTWSSYNSCTVSSCNNGYTQSGNSCVANACTPESSSTTCSGKCGTQTNNCGASVSCTACSTPTTGNYTVLFENNFEHRPLGKYATQAEFVKDWQSANGWGNRGYDFEIISDSLGAQGKIGKITYPFYDSKDFKWICWGDGCGDSSGKRIVFNTKPAFGSVQFLNGVGPHSGGGQWNVDLKGSYNDVYVTYKIRFSPDFNAVGGGKMMGGFGSGEDICPACANTDCVDASGVKCANPPCDGIADDFSSRLMFHKNSLSYYLYFYGKTNICGDSRGLSGSNVVFDGKWHTIIYRTRLNNYNDTSGLVETWIDGKKVESWGGLQFRKGANTFGIDIMRVSTFFGGDSSEKFEKTYSWNTMCSKGSIDSWIQPRYDICAVNPKDPCSDVLRYSDGSPYYFYAPRKTEYLYIDDVKVYIPK